MLRQPGREASRHRLPMLPALLMIAALSLALWSLIIAGIVALL